MRLTFLIACAFLLAGLHAQPTWRFHLAFENGDGARDTIWLVYDTSATLGWDGSFIVDTALGEGGVPMNSSVFNVWVHNVLGDSTKTEARPYSAYPEMYAQVNAFNWQAPITIRWDTTLFNAPYLPAPDSIGLAVMEGTHFFFYNNDPWLHAFNMLIDNSVMVNDVDEVDVLFPIDLGFAAHSTVGLPQAPLQSTLSIWPVPLDNGPLYVRSEVPCSIQVFDPMGRQVIRSFTCNGLCAIDLPFLKPGTYLLRGVEPNNRIHHATLIK